MLRPPTATSLADLDSPAWLHWLSRINDPHRLLGSDRQAKIDKAMADLAEIGVTDVDLPFTQRTVVGRNPDIGIEISCEIVTFFLAQALTHKQDIKRLFDVPFLEAECGRIVAEWDSHPVPPKAPEPAAALHGKLHALGVCDFRSHIKTIVGAPQHIFVFF